MVGGSPPLAAGAVGARDLAHGRALPPQGVMVKTRKLRQGLIAGLILAWSVAPARGNASNLAAGTRCWIDNGALVASAAFGDIAGDFLIDLSAPHSLLERSRAALDGVETASVTRTLVFAGRSSPAVSLAVGDLDARTRRFGTVINGVLGADLFSRFVVEIDPSPCRIRLVARAGRPPAGGARLAVDMASGRPLVAARIADGVRVRSGLFALDTAAWPVTLFGDRLSRDVPTDGGPPVARLRAMTLAGRLFEQVPAVVIAAPDAPGPPVARGAVGLSVLSRWRLRLDMRGGRLDLIPEN